MNPNAFLTVPNLSLRENLIHGFTTKALGADCERVAKALGVGPSAIVSLEQIHSGEVVCIEQGTDLKKLPPGDALVTSLPGIVIGVMTADCLPILVHDPKARVVAAIHAGWRGLVAGVITHALDAMFRRYGCRLENLEFAFGPCISEAHFEVGEEVMAKFREAFGVRFAHHQKPGEKAHIDLSGTARMACEDIGFYHRNFADVGLCTFERDDLFHSYRRAPGAGRQFNFIGLKAP